MHEYLSRNVQKGRVNILNLRAGGGSILAIIVGKEISVIKDN